MPRPRTHTPATALAALAVVACLFPAGAAIAVADDTCVGEGEYGRIKAGMTIQKLGQVLQGQVPFAETEGKGKKRFRWYAACDAWEPDLDVVVRYHQPVVGRRTVSKKSLDVFVAPARVRG